MNGRSKIYRKNWENFNKASLLKGIHIHHIDGNYLNNDISNLWACTPEEHWLIHCMQGDSVALKGEFIQYANNWVGKNHSDISNLKNAINSGAKPFIGYEAICIRKGGKRKWLYEKRNRNR